MFFMLCSMSVSVSLLNMQFKMFSEVRSEYTAVALVLVILVILISSYLHSLYNYPDQGFIFIHETL